MATSTPSGCLDRLLAESLAMVQRERVEHPLAGDLALVVAALASCGEAHIPTPCSRPASNDWLATACELADPGAESLTRALLDASPHLQWYTPYDRDSAPVQYLSFIDGYASTMLCGTPRPHGAQPVFVIPGLLFAFALQAPHLHYPAHHHPAHELYRVLGGTSRWWRGGEDWQIRSPGSWLAHEHHQEHAMQTTDQPLLALAMWVDHVQGSAQFSRLPGSMIATARKPQ